MHGLGLKGRPSDAARVVGFLRGRTRHRLKRVPGDLDPTLGASEELARLMQAAQAGDGGAYAELLHAITPRIRRVVARQRGFAGAEAVEDLVQDVLLSVHAVRATFDPGRPFMPWLLAIVRHRLADGARKYGRSAAHEVAVEDLEVTFSTVATNPNQEASHDVDALRRAIEALPAGQRQAVDLLKMREFSLREASAVTGVSVGALKVATHRGLASLRRALARRRGGHED
jgi:RNA polymerase sigma factor (sigma-70 family)